MIVTDYNADLAYHDYLPNALRGKDIARLT
jgi:hypothetical protein